MPEKLRRPPRIKVFEALGSIADGRVEILETEPLIKARVTSSTGEKTYTVIIDMNNRIAYSDDNGTKHRGYVGYPIIAVLMKTGNLPYDERLAEALKGIPWKKLNEQYKKYSTVEQIAFRQAAGRGVYHRELEGFARTLLIRLSKLNLQYDETLGESLKKEETGVS